MDLLSKISAVNSEVHVDLSWNYKEGLKTVYLFSKKF